MTVEAPGVDGDLLVLVVVEDQPVRVELQYQGTVGIGRRDAVAIGFEGHAGTVVGPHREVIAGLVEAWVERAQLGDFVEEQFVGGAPGVGVLADVGDGVEPMLRLGVEGIEGMQLQPIEKARFDIGHSTLNPSLLLGLPWRTRLDDEPIVLGEVHIPRVQGRRTSQRMIEHRGLAVVDHDLRGESSHEKKRVLLGAQELFHRLSEGELDIHPAAVTQHQDQKAHPPPRGSNLYPPGVTPIHLGTLTRKELQT